MLMDAGGIAGNAQGTETFAIPFATIRRGTFAFEVHDDVVGVAVAYCIDLR
jgi:hypothetical protein